MNGNQDRNLRNRERALTSALGILENKMKSFEKEKEALVMEVREIFNEKTRIKKEEIEIELKGKNIDKKLYQLKSDLDWKGKQLKGLRAEIRADH